MDWKREIPFPVFRRQFYKKVTPSGVQAKTKDKNIIVVAAINAFVKAGEGLKDGDEITTDVVEPWIEGSCIYGDVRTFLFSTELLASLDKTDVKQIPADLMKIPFDVIYLDFSNLPVDIRGLRKTEDDKGEELRGVFLVSADCAGTGVLALGFRIDNYPAPDALSPLIHGLLINEKKLIQPNTVTVIPIFYAPGVFDKIVGEEAPWGETRYAFEPKEGMFDIKGLIDLLSDDEREETTIYLKRIFNGLLYINSVNADIREEWLHQNLVPRLKGKTGKAKRGLRTAIEEGGKVQRAGYYVYIPNVAPPSDSNITGRTIDCRFLVRGHWHHYWVGTDRLGTKKLEVRWLQPYLKGPDIAEEIHKTYIVDK